MTAPLIPSIPIVDLTEFRLEYACRVHDMMDCCFCGKTSTELEILYDYLKPSYLGQVYDAQYLDWVQYYDQFFPVQGAYGDLNDGSLGNTDRTDDNMSCIINTIIPDAVQNFLPERVQPDAILFLETVPETVQNSCKNKINLENYNKINLENYNNQNYVDNLDPYIDTQTSHNAQYVNWEKYYNQCFPTHMTQGTTPTYGELKALGLGNTPNENLPQETHPEYIVGQGIENSNCNVTDKKNNSDSICSVESIQNYIEQYSPLSPWSQIEEQNLTLNISDKQTNQTVGSVDVYYPLPMESKSTFTKPIPTPQNPVITSQPANIQLSHNSSTPQFKKHIQIPNKNNLDKFLQAKVKKTITPKEVRRCTANLKSLVYSYFNISKTACGNLNQQSVIQNLKEGLERHSNLLLNCAVDSRFFKPPNKKSKKSNSTHCDKCHVDIETDAWNSHLRTNIHKANSCTIFEDGVEIMKSAFKRRIISYKITSSTFHVDIKKFRDEIKERVLKLIQMEQIKHKLIKLNFELFSFYHLPTSTTHEIKSHNTPYEIVCSSTNINETFDHLFNIIDRKADEFAERDSGWILLQILHLEVNINKYNPLQASTYLPLPISITKKNAIVNIKNNDEYCFAYSVVASLYNGDPNNVATYPDFRTVFDFSEVTFPMKIKDIPNFEQKNNVSINVYGLELVFKNGKNMYEIIGPLHYGKVKQNHHINLLLFSDENKNGELCNHYCYIKNLSALISSQISKNEHKKHFCDGCLQFFTSSEKLEQHRENDCNFIRNDFPTMEPVTDKFGNIIPANILKFENIQKQMRVPFIIYADFECILKPIENNNVQDPLSSYTVKKFEHIPYAYAYYIKCSFDEQESKFYLSQDENVSNFIDNIENDVRTLYNKYLKNITPMKKLTLDETKNYNETNICYICKKPFKDLKQKVKDHCHITGNFRGAAHSICNLNYKLPSFIPIVLHNLKNYDCHLFIKTMCKQNESIDVIAINKEKYISFSKNLLVDTYTNCNGNVKSKILKLRFIDSFQFLSSSLDSLAQSLEDKQCCEIYKNFPDNVKFKYIRQKGVFPYSYIDNVSKLDEPHLPSKDKFYNDLNDEDISEQEYQHAKNVWDIFECKSLRDYSNIYLKSDVLLLADIFENYRNTCLKTYKLDPAWYFSAPGLSWDAMLLYTGVELELLTDPDIVHFFKKGVRGGVSTCVNRKAIANNPFVQNYNSLEPVNYIMYLDATNLYGFSMSQNLPQKDFAWVSQEEINTIDIFNISDNAEVGYVLEVDLEYPNYLHKAHNELPFCPENIAPPNSKNVKLIPNLENKKHYIIHYINLKQCLKFGLILTKIHRAVKFTQSPWLQKYIDLNTQMRNKSKNKFEKNLYKLKNNSIYGKTMENVENRVDIKLVSQWRRNKNTITCAELLLAKPQFKNLSIFSENLIAVQMQKTRIVYNKPIYVGFSILDISKTVLYDFFYNYLKPSYKQNLELLYTDTDSLIFNVFTSNFYEDMKRNIDKYDTSNYPINNIHNIPQNKSIVGKFKDEYAGESIKSFYGTGAKAYCIKTENHVVKKAKGVKKSTINKQLSITDYVEVIERNSKIYCTMYVFKSHLHTIYTELINKLALTAEDDKRFIIPGSTKTLAWGNKDIQFYINQNLHKNDVPIDDEQWKRNLDEFLNTAIELM
ncbi:hypothetical protein NQ317_013331 [Molorchus minor]|uniref:DNA-directed DNA polymerase n=1 Tax=Molorchus minor TaxID=1323400 RepID=A0ABQ9K031_9CUCU|nr:hypothetical protein NQ317_013331 [Molorchus minor]